MMRAPEFWRADAQSLWPALLQPAAWLFDIAQKTRFKHTTPQNAPVPVICVGNFTAGGAGKTPTAIALAAMLHELGRRPGFLSRGYGGSNKVTLLVDGRQHAAALVGDEALLLARHAPTVVSPSRPAGARLAAANDVDALIMDDGLQNPALKKDLSICVIDAAYGIGNGHVLPAGPLRGSLSFQLELVDAVLIVGDETPDRRLMARIAQRALPVFHARMALADAASLRGKRLVAYAGIGRPDKFFSSLAAAGAVLAATQAYPDHHPFDNADADHLLELAGMHDGLLVTTEKDVVRLRQETGSLATLRAATTAIAANLEFSDPDALKALLSARLRA